MDTPIELFWINIKNDCPKKNQLVDVWHIKKGRIPEVYIYYAKDYEDEPLWQSKYGTFEGSKEITHWMIIPKKPLDL